MANGESELGRGQAGIQFSTGKEKQVGAGLLIPGESARVEYYRNQLQTQALAVWKDMLAAVKPVVNTQSNPDTFQEAQGPQFPPVGPDGTKNDMSDIFAAYGISTHPSERKHESEKPLSLKDKVNAAWQKIKGVGPAVGFAGLAVASAACGAAKVEQIKPSPVPAATGASPTEAPQVKQPETPTFKKYSGIESLSGVLDEISPTLKPETKGNNFQTLIETMKREERVIKNSLSVTGTNALTQGLHLDFNYINFTGAGKSLEMAYLDLGQPTINGEKQPKQVLYYAFVNPDGTMNTGLATYETNKITYLNIVPLDTEELVPNNSKTLVNVVRRLDGRLDIATYDAITGRLSDPITVDQPGAKSLFGIQVANAEGLTPSTTDIPVTVTAPPTILAPSSITDTQQFSNTVATGQLTPTMSYTLTVGAPVTVTGEITPAVSLTPTVSAGEGITATATSTATLPGEGVTKTESLVDSINAQLAADEYVKAMKAVGQISTTNEVLNGLTIGVVTDTLGINHQVAFTPDKVPLLINEGGWKGLTAKYSEQINNFSIGTSIDGYEGAQNDIGYRNAAGTYFSSLYLDGQIMPSNTRSGNWSAGMNAFELAKRNKQILYIHPGFYPSAETDDIRNGSVDTINKYVDSRIDNLLNLVDTSNGKPTFMNFINEASWTYKGEVGMFKDTDTPSNPFYKAYGKDWVSELYVKIFNKAQSKGIAVGKDLILIDNESGMYFQGKKVDLMTNYLLAQKKIIASKLNIPIDQVKIGVGVELHMSPNPDNGNYFKIPTDAEFTSAIESLSKVGDIFITESDVKGLPQEDQVKYLIHFMELAKKSGKVREMDLFHTLRFVPPYDKNNAFENGANGLINKDFMPTALYYRLLQALFS